MNKLGFVLVNLVNFHIQSIQYKFIKYDCWGWGLSVWPLFYKDADHPGTFEGCWAIVDDGFDDAEKIIKDYNEDTNVAESSCKLFVIQHLAETPVGAESRLISCKQPC